MDASVGMHISFTECSNRIIPVRTHPADLWRVVYDSFNDVVLDPKADVLVEVYMPGCKACGALSPRVHMLSDLLAAQGIKGVKLALMVRPRGYMLMHSVWKCL